MQITVSGKQVDVGENLRAHIEKRIEDAIHKYLDRMVAVDVVISREAYLFRADIHGNTGTHSGVTIKSRGEGADAYIAFDAACDKIEKQLRRYKRRLTNHHRTQREAERAAFSPQTAKKYVLTGDAGEQEVDAPVIVAEKVTQLDSLTVGEAVMRMDLADLPALMFFNSGNGRLNVVYRRADGNISWLDPQLPKAAVA